MPARMLQATRYTGWRLNNHRNKLNSRQGKSCRYLLPQWRNSQRQIDCGSFYNRFKATLAAAIDASCRVITATCLYRCLIIMSGRQKLKTSMNENAHKYCHGRE